MNKNNLPVGTRVTFYPVDGASYSAEGTLLRSFVFSGNRRYTVRVLAGTGAGKDWTARPHDIISVEPKPGAWGQI